MIVAPEYAKLRSEELSSFIMARFTSTKLEAKGENLWLIKLTSVEEKLRIITLKDELTNEIRNEEIGSESRGGWVEITGIPAHVWHTDVVRAVAEAPGFPVRGILRVPALERTTANGPRERIRLKRKRLPTTYRARQESWLEESPC
ncbi:hypothetical protein H6P81_017885 [Aristolochia fimbriata]|uniref:DUF4283 domain-containing protein n=1 Tax=Aristolochia fimbriata TaxID=158543 RepID=A0AAV7E2C6_ARIFI|nr:hypothetical protein H6P81_017885 [Aristolochia fimbriata]